MCSRPAVATERESTVPIVLCGDYGLRIEAGLPPVPLVAPWDTHPSIDVFLREAPKGELRHVR